MARTTEVEVTSEGVLIPRSLLPAWEDIKEVEIERRGDSILIKPKASGDERVRDRIVRKMKNAGLVETLPWAQPPMVSSEERARLVEKLSRGEPLSESIIAEREDRA